MLTWATPTSLLLYLLLSPWQLLTYSSLLKLSFQECYLSGIIWHVTFPSVRRFSHYLSVNNFWVWVYCRWRNMPDFMLLNLLKFVSWSNIWSILEGVPWAPENNMYYDIVEWSILWMLIWSCWFMVVLSPSIYLLSFCLLLSVVEKWSLHLSIYLFLLSVLSVLLHIFCSSVVWCMHI